MRLSVARRVLLSFGIAIAPFGLAACRSSLDAGGPGGSATLVLFAHDSAANAIAGVRFDFRHGDLHVSGGPTDATGHATATVPAGAGTLVLQLPPDTRLATNQDQSIAVSAPADMTTTVTVYVVPIGAQAVVQ